MWEPRSLLESNVLTPTPPSFPPEVERILPSWILCSGCLQGLSSSPKQRIFMHSQGALHSSLGIFPALPLCPSDCILIHAPPVVKIAVKWGLRIANLDWSPWCSQRKYWIVLRYFFSCLKPHIKALLHHLRAVVTSGIAVSEACTKHRSTEETCNTHSYLPLPIFPLICLTHYFSRAFAHALSTAWDALLSLPRPIQV